jgi:hypothetical protein
MAEPSPAAALRLRLPHGPAAAAAPPATVDAQAAQTAAPEANARASSAQPAVDAQGQGTLRNVAGMFSRRCQPLTKDCVHF